MEEVSEKLRQGELKKEGISEAYEQLQAQASKLLSFTAMWKDLEEHFYGIQRSLECRSVQLLESERSLKELVESKEGELRSLQRRIEECEGEIGGKTRELTSVKEQVKRLCDERESERIGVDGKNLLTFLGQQFKEQDRAFSKALEIIQTSTDAAKLVLDGIEGF